MDILTKIKNLSVTTVKELQRFLGLVNYISGFYYKLAEDRVELNKLLGKKPPPWTEYHDRLIQNIKNKCSKLPPLKLPGPGYKIVETDASEFAWSGVLREQQTPEYNPKDKGQIVRTVSGSFHSSEKDYHSTHKEILAVVNSFQAFQMFIADKRFLLKSDLQNLRGFFKKESKNKVVRGRLLRWAQLLCTYEFDCIHIPGAENITADSCIL